MMETVFTLASVFLYLWVSTLLLYHRLISRWVAFSLGYFFVFGLASYFFFGRVALPHDVRLALMALPPFLFFFLPFVAVGFCLLRGLSVSQTCGVLILCGIFMAALASSDALRTDFFEPLGSTAKAGLEIASVLLVLLGVPVSMGVWLFNGWTAKQGCGGLIVFLAFGVCIAVVVSLTIGYETLTPLARSAVEDFVQAVSRWKDELIQVFQEERREWEEWLEDGGGSTRFLTGGSFLVVMVGFVLEDVVRSFGWLGHRGLTELVGLHPDYRPGRSHFEVNRRRGLFPRIWYAGGGEDVVGFVRKFAGERMVCFSLNARSRVAVNERGYLRGSREEEIESAQNAVFDLDLVGDSSRDRLREVWGFLDGADSYFLEQGLLKPVRAYTGRGFHLLFAFPEVPVSEVPDLRDRLRVFRDGFAEAFSGEFGRLEVRLDRTQDLRRVVKVYGTAKPDVGLVSRFFGGERVEDLALRDYLQGLSVPSYCGVGNGLDLGAGRELPLWFGDLLEGDELVGRLWRGEGKPAGLDTSRSGYDFSLVQRLLSLGKTDVAELATVLSLRPGGAGREKGDGYIRRTIAAALVR